MMPFYEPPASTIIPSLSTELPPSRTSSCTAVTVPSGFPPSSNVWFSNVPPWFDVEGLCPSYPITSGNTRSGESEVFVSLNVNKKNL